MSTDKSANVRRLPKPEPITAEKLAAAGLADTPATGPEPDIRAQLYLETLTRATYSGDAVLSLPPVTWLIPRWVPDSALGALYAPPGAGKSFYALALALELARGGRWAGYEMGEPVSVVYVGAEAPAVLGERARAWCLYHGSSIPDTFHLLAAAPQLLVTEQLEALEARCAELRPRLVVIDTLALSTVGVNENDGTEWSRVAEALRRVGRSSPHETEHGSAWASVLAVHHTGKDLTKGLRGHTALHGALDYEIVLDGSPAQLRARSPKQRMGETPLPEYYRLETVELPPPAGKLTPGTFSQSGAVLLPLTYSEVQKSREDQILEALRDTYRDGASRADLESVLGLKRDATQKELTKLEQAGQIERSGSGPSTRYKLAGHLLLAASTAPQELEPF